MKLSLKTKLTLSYILLSLFLVGCLLFVCNYFLEEKFQDYIIEKQEKKNTTIVSLVTNEFGDKGEVPSTKSLENIGDTALSQGMVLMVNDKNNDELFCMSTKDRQVCDNMIESMRTHMASVYQNFKGEYVQKTYDITIDDTTVGTVTLGFYGPFYYNDEDIQFLSILNKLFLFISIISLILAAFLGYFMAGRIVDPIKKVINRAKDIETGNYSDKLTISSKTNEINELIHSINSLTVTLERQQLSKKRMAKDYAHEFRTPLATLQSNLEAMIDGIWEPTEQRLESCREEILRLTRMVSEIDKIVKIENDNYELHKVNFDLAEIAEQVSRNIEPDATSKNIKLEIRTTKCTLTADKDKIVQLIINLLTNAIKYTDNYGKIHITVKKTSDDAVLIVSDTGIGISADDLPNIFDHLYRTDKSRNRDTGGSGIGLSVVKAIVDAHGGRIVAESEPGRGSKFIITLPIV